MNWDPIINGAVLIICVLWLASVVTKQTIGEMLRGIIDFINGTKDDALDKGEELLYYD